MKLESSRQKKIKLLAEDILARARLEDFPKGDITTNLIGNFADEYHMGRLYAKSSFILSGIDLVREMYLRYSDGSIKFETKFGNGAQIKEKDIVFEVSGRLKDLLILERTVLNTLGLMIAVATNTRRFTDKLSDTGIKIYDTRKTLPGLRDLEKLAVLDGGGYNHRQSLSDAVLLKENHLRYFDINFLEERLSELKNADFVEIEVDSLGLLNKLLELSPANIDIIMLDNFTPSDVVEAVNKIAGRYIIEVSGGITLDNIEQYIIDGVDRIAVGSITHSISYPDISFIIE